MKVKIQEISPAAAKKYLGMNTHNRKKKQTRAEMYASMMREGNWLLSWDAIAISDDGVLLNGQHRLEGVVLSGVTCSFIVVTDIEKDVQDVGDKPGQRKLDDVLELHGEKNSTGLAALVRSMDTFLFRGIVGFKQKHNGGVITTHRALEILAAYPTMKEFASIGKDLRSIPSLAPSTTNILRYLFFLVDEEDSEVFFRGLSVGESLKAGDPILVLKNRLQQEEAKTTTNLHQGVAAAITIKAWNAWRQGETIKQLKFQAGGSRPESFPLIDGLDFLDLPLATK